MTAKAQGQGVQQLCSYFCIPTHKSVKVWSLIYYFTDIWVKKRNKTVSQDDTLDFKTYINNRSDWIKSMRLEKE